MFGSNYGYRSSLNNSMIDHLKHKYKKLNSKIKFKKNDNVLDIGSNDGTFLNFFLNRLINSVATHLQKNLENIIKKILK